MRLEARQNIIGDTDVEGAVVTAGEDVDEVAPAPVICGSSVATNWLLGEWVLAFARTTRKISSTGTN
jgi:hypothetical protein